MFLIPILLAAAALPALPDTAQLHESWQRARLVRELSRFPSAEECSRQLERGRRHRQWALEHGQLFSWERDDWTTYLRQIDEWLSVWEALSFAQDSSWDGASVDYRRWQLAFVREAIGEANYAAGYVPSPVASYFEGL